MELCEFNIDEELKIIAEKITEHGLNFGGALFEHESGEEFVITVTKANYMHEKSDRIAELEAGLKELLEWTQSMTSLEYQHEIDKFEQLLEQPK